ncbi:Glucoamylase [Roseomonas mucosa]|uniref:Trehalase n=1 Tax=Roseomonas mucosa TaxID=207340 RepID=A0A379N6S0_9PROT|nr:MULTISPECIES: glycoside hydrolase family 15 protein [Roseomonas]MBS5901534.1 glycoside hydrolase family 15 protein [Acetobacteraceae bacterium]MCG7355864.1 glycoside hydrolase family 15 protein [Roseomonas mucosa]MDT8288872.1 glycoside hydrolase family 15 protein [Roseomonas mucosa]MDT8293715.1 glycoside hydrolase family 15 protein [Roseomonas mucosa]MDT8312190.1 glycoside hydrolase family 15 protein [Roseomonas mucosa]
MPGRIEDYALIGDLATAALVGRDGSIDWLCWPRFDSDAVFAALLGTPEHGRWRIAPDWEGGERPHIRRAYRDGTLVLDTEFRTGSGAVRLTDFMNVRDDGVSNLVRIVTGLRGEVAMRGELVLRFDNGRVIPWVSRLPDGTGIRAVAGPDLVVMRTGVPVRGEDMHSVSRFVVKAGESVPFVLSYGASHLPPPPPLDPGERLAETESGWRQWAAGCAEAGPWTDAVRRSVVTLKALTYRPTGGIVAAPTTSLPEKLGGSRNWDYRFCWLRDSTLTLMALLRAGYVEDAAAWRDWLVRAVAGSPDQIQIMYGLAGERRLTEYEADWLPGYEDSRPVRVGNAAYRQLQLDVFGEVANTLYQAHRHGLAFDRQAWSLQHALTDHLAKVWKQPDEGMWEVRSGPEQFTFSKVAAWAAVDRAVRSIEHFGMRGPLKRWRALRQRIHEDVCRRGFDPELGSFTRAYGSGDLDANLLLLPAVGFLPYDDPRVRGTIAAVEKRLLRGGFLLRYATGETLDGLPGDEGVFLACSFWLANAYHRTGRRHEALDLFGRLLDLRNDVGLLSEEYDPGARRLIGNFPQAFSHIALVNTAYELSGHPGGREAEDGPPPARKAGRSPPPLAPGA